MLPYALIDLHCDTLTALTPEDAPLLAALQDPARREQTVSVFAERVRAVNTLDLPGRHFSLSAIPEEVRWCQCCAIFIPDELSPEESAAYYALHQRSFDRQMEALSERVRPCRTAADIEAAWAAGKTAAILTVENGSALAGRLERIEVLARDGVRMMTLTWNGENELGSGNATGHGLSEFGKEAVRELERAGILADVSHLNDHGLDGFLSVSTKPFAASHSNARSVCGHKRNRPAVLDDLWRHAEHFLELGAEHCLALGSDADGTDVPPGLDCPAAFAGLYQYLLDRGLSPKQADGILWKNALNFFKAQLF